MRFGSTSSRVSSQSTIVLAQMSALYTAVRPCRRSASPVPGWSTTSDDTPRWASQRGRPTRYFISFVESRPLSWTSIGARPLDAFGAHVKRRQMAVVVGDLDALAVLARQLHAASKKDQQAAVQREAARRAVRLQPLGRQIVGRGAAVLVAGRNQPAACFVLFGKLAQLVGHLRPGLAEGGVPAASGCLAASCRGAHMASISPMRAPISMARSTERFQT